MSDKKTDYSFMKSGFNNLIEPEKPDPEMIKNVTALVATFTENALIDASRYVSHCNRKCITTMDIKLCLMAETFKFMNRDNTVSLLKWKEIVNNEDEYEDESDYSSEDELEEEFSKSECNCDNCVYINKVENIWNNWTPTTDLEKILKNVIDNQI